MAGFYMWETADLAITLTGDGNPLEDYSKVVVSIYQPYGRVDLTDDSLGIDVDAQTINVHMTQEQTGKFKAGTAEIQVNVYYSDTERDTSAKGVLTVYDNLYRQAMP